MINRLRSKNKVIFIPDKAADGLPLKNKFPTNTRDFVKSIIYKLIYSSKASLITIEHEKTTFISNRHLNMLTDKIIGKNQRDLELNKIDLASFNLFTDKKYEILYLGHNAYNIRSSKKDMIETLQKVYDIVLQYFPKEKVGYKLHPGRENDISMEFGCEIEDYIPAEFLFNEYVKIYITPYSSAISNMNDKLCISLIDLIPTKNHRLKEYIKGRLNNMSIGKLHFPKTLIDFEKLMKISQD